MLIRLIMVISLILFLLLLLSGISMEVALYRSVLVFMILFSIVYISIFLLNVIRGNPNSTPTSVPVGGSENSTSETET